MPCDSSYMEANGLEVQLSRVLMLLDELETGRPVDTSSGDWRGYKQGVYNEGDLRKRTDEATATLCARLHKVKDVTKYSLEMQTWWRDHQKADAERERREAQEREEKRTRKAAISKLTPKERRALGLDKPKD